MDIALLAQRVAEVITPALPALLGWGNESAKEIAKKIGDDAWTLAKKLWRDVEQPLKQDGAVQDITLGADQTATGDSVRQALARILESDPALSHRIQQQLSSSPHHISARSEGSQNFGNISAQYVDMSTTHGLSALELERSRERQKLEAILTLFDRRAVRDSMHEEQVMFMVKSLQELREKIQQAGLSTIRQPEVRMLLEQIRQDLEEIEFYVSMLLQMLPGDDWADSMIDLRSFGAVAGYTQLAPPLRGEAERRLRGVLQFCESRVRHFDRALDINHHATRTRTYGAPEPDLTPNVPVNTRQLAKDLFCIYLFGSIDEAKRGVVAKLDAIERATQ